MLLTGCSDPPPGGEINSDRAGNRRPCRDRIAGRAQLSQAELVCRSNALPFVVRSGLDAFHELCRRPAAVTPGRSASCSAGENTLLRINRLQMSEVRPEEEKIIEMVTN
jgi:hypothetical protein